MAGFRVEGNISGNVAEVDTNNNLKTTGPLNSDYAGFTQLSGSLSVAAAPAAAITQKVAVSNPGRLTVGAPVMLMAEMFNNTTLNSAIFTAPVSTMTVTCAAGTLNLNPTANTTTSAVARVSTYATFPMQADYPTVATWEMSLTQGSIVNDTIEAGFVIHTSTSAATDGAFFRYDNAGTFKAVVNNNTTEVMSAALTAPSANVMHKYRIIVDADKVFFYVDDVCQAAIAAPTGLGFPVYAPSQPFSIRILNGATPPGTANTVKVGYISISIQDGLALGKENSTIAAMQGRMGSQGQTGQATVGTLALFSNNLAAGAGAVMSNTGANLGTGLGGQFSAQPTLAAGTDGILSQYLNPLATAAIPGKILYVKGVRVQGVVTTILAGGPVIYAYSLYYGMTTASLASAESATGKAARRVPIGIETFAATAAVGVVGSAGGQYMPFLAPIAIYPGEYIGVAAKNLGTVTSSGVITCLVSFDCYWE